MKKTINSDFHRLACLFMILLALSSCTKNETEVIDTSTFGYDYFPVTIGKRWIYQTDSIVYTQKIGTQIDSSKTYQLEEVVDTFRNSENQLVYRLDISYAKDTAQDWVLISSYFIQKDQLEFHKIENGLDYIKLVFPLRKYKSWYGNIRISSKTEFNIRGESLRPFTENWYYSYDYLDKPEYIGGKFYDKVSRVTEEDDENLLEKRYSVAKYAKGIGMIYKELWILDTQNTNNSIPFKDRAAKGMILRQALVSHN